AIAGIGSLSRAIEDGLARDARKLLGGDVSLSIVHRPATPTQQAWLAGRGTVSAIAELRAMAYVRNGGGQAPPPASGAGTAAGAARDRLLVEVKAVDARYPMFGAVEAGGTAGDS